MITAIVCVDKNWGIGYNGKLLAHIPEDMRFFKETTTNSVVIMGRKTYDSLKRPLPHRVNVVITSKTNLPCEIDENGVIFVSMDFAKLYLSTVCPWVANHYIIGGGQIYEELLPYCHKAYVTKVDYAYENVDTYFPNLDKMQNWKMRVEEYGEEKMHQGIEYKFCVYKKV